VLKNKGIGQGNRLIPKPEVLQAQHISEELASSSDNARKPLTSCTEISGTTAPVKQYHSASPHQLICLTGNAPGEQGGCLKNSRWRQRKACELTQKCQSAMAEDKSDKDVLGRIMLKTVCSLVYLVVAEQHRSSAVQWHKRMYILLTSFILIKIKKCDGRLICYRPTPALSGCP